jgi:hypothetical protein
MGRGDGTSMGRFFSTRTPSVKRYSLLTAIAALNILTLPTLGAMAGGGQPWGHVLLVSPYSAGCEEYGDTPFEHEDTSRWPPKT